MIDHVSREEEEKSIKITQRVVVAVGAVLVLTGIVLQWPIMGKTYRQFIEGDGYLPLMVGLIAIILGFSIRLLTGDFYEEPGSDKKNSGESGREK